MQSITITVPLPNRDLHQNARKHWAAKARATKGARSTARIYALHALAGNPAPRWVKASARITFYWPDKRIRDPEGAMSSLKATWDGFQDAGIVANDSGIWPERPVYVYDDPNPRVEIILTEEQQ